MRALLTVFALFFFTTLLAQSPIGKWKTVDEAGKTKSVVEIYQKNGKVYGKIIKLFRPAGTDQNPNCRACTGDRKGQKLIGMEIIRDLKKDGNEYSDGTIMDPETGKIYDCKIWVEGGKLQLRGYVAFFFRTQTWLPYKE